MDSASEGFDPDPIECPEGAEPKLFRFTETRIQNRQPLSAVGWRCFRADGKRHGPSMEWFADGQPSAVTNWSGGDKHGRFEMWHPNGQKKAEGEHDHWVAVGVWTTWDEQGNVVTRKDFGRPGDEAAAAESGEPAPEAAEPADAAESPPGGVPSAAPSTGDTPPAESDAS